jgi:Uma2 family endonuclease
VEKLGAEVNVKITYRDYLEFPDDGRRYEVIDGDAIVTPAPNLRHQRVLANLYFALSLHVRAQRLGELLFAPCDVVLTDTTIVQPDLIFVSKERRAVLEKARIAGAPDLAVEILSPSTATRDRSLKLQTYERHGVAHYWLLDPERGDLEEYVLSDGKFRLVSKLTGPVAFQPRVFPGFTLDLGQVWAE